ncbi:hypothetical protein COCNU_scaffold001259G000090 [Cocos nucifera]|nr:hypothetical protein [Cocos nucifera]
MDAKGLQARKRKGKAPGESLKRAKINISSSAAPTTASKATESPEVAPITEVGAIDGVSVPPTSSNLLAEDRAPKLLAEKEKGEEKKKKKKLIVVKEKTVEVDHLVKKKAAKVEGLQEVLRKKELTSVGLKAALALEEERRKKAEAKIAELKDQTSRQISEAMIQMVEEFKVFYEMRDLNVAFSQKAFQKGFELCKD